MALTTTQYTRTIPLPAHTLQTLRGVCTLVKYPAIPEHHTAINNRINDVIKNLYGDQSETINEIRRADSEHVHLKGQRCEVLLKEGQPVGFIIYQNQLEPSYKPDTADSLKLCHLELMNSKDAGEGYRSLLYKRIEEVAKERFAKSIHTTVANRDPLFSYLQKHDFKIDRLTSPNTRAGYSTSLLHYDIPKEKQAQPQERQTQHLPLVHSTAQEDSRPDKKRKADDDDNHDVRHSNYAQQRQPQSEHVEDHKKYRRDHEERRLEAPQRTTNNPPPTVTPKLHQIPLRRQYIYAIRNGSKTIEGRVNMGQFKNIRAGDKVRFYYYQNAQDDVVCEVRAIKSYDSFRSMLTTEGFKNCVPDDPSLEAACRTYDNIPNYTANAAKYGVLAIHLKVVPNSR